MTGTAKVKSAKTDAELARNFDRRISAAENPSAVRCGDWVFSTSDSGNLIASYVNGGSVILVTPPPAGQDPDAVAETQLPFIKVRRTADQSAPQNTLTTVIWDTIDSSSGAWTGDITGFSQLTVPEDGFYLANFHLAWKSSTTDVRKGVLAVNGFQYGAQEFRPTLPGWIPSMYINDCFDLKAGDVIEGKVFNNSSGGALFSASTADPESYTSMSIVKLR